MTWTEIYLKDGEIANAVWYMTMTSGQEKRKIKAIKNRNYNPSHSSKEKIEGKIFPKARHTAMKIWCSNPSNCAHNQKK